MTHRGQPAAHGANPITRMEPMRAAIAVIPLGLALAGCPASAEDVRPPADAFYFPTGLALSPDDRYLFVSNANSDLRYGSSSLQLVDVDVVDALVRRWVDDGEVPAGCAQDPEVRETVVCPEEADGDGAAFLVPGATVRLGNFAGDIGTQTLADGRVRLFLPVRGDPSITWVDFDPATELFECGGSGDYPRCDVRHQITQLRGDPDQGTLTSEPFGIFVDGDNGYAVVAHLTTGNVSLVATPPDDSEPPVLADVKGGFFTTRVNGLRGAVGVAGRRPGTADDLVYVTSRVESRVQMLHVEQPPDGGFPLLAPTDYFFVNTVFPADDSRGIAFSAGGDRAHVINRNPPTLITVDTSDDADGRPRNEVLIATELCPQAGIVAVADVGAGERAYVSCFRDGQVWVIDPEAATLEAVVNAGRGPHAIAVSEARKQMYVTNFLENTIAVIDLTPGAPTENRVVVRLGEPDLGDD